MSITYRIDEERGVVWTKAAGRLTDDDLIEHKRALLADSRFRPGMRELSDVRGVDALEVTPDGIRRAAEFDAGTAPGFEGHALALLVPSDLLFGMARMYEMRTEGNTGGVMVFRSRAEALAWLGVPARDAVDL